MKIVAIAFIAIMIGLVACDEKKKSSDKEITRVVVGGQAYTLQNDGTTFSWEYPKSGPNAWGSVPTWPAPVDISHTGASISPAGNTITLNTETGAGVTITVTAEDGSTKPFLIRATRDMRDW